MSSHKRYQQTPEQIALSEQRKAKKLKSAQAPPVQASDPGTAEIVERVWLPIQSIHNGQRELQRIKILSWNVCPPVCLNRRSA